MWMREPLPIEVSRVANVPIGGQFWDEVADAPMDISGYLFSGVVATNDGEAVIYNFPVTITSAQVGMVDFVINGSALASGVGTKETIVYSYQIKATDAQSNSVIALRGPLILTPGI